MRGFMNGKWCVVVALSVFLGFGASPNPSAQGPELDSVMRLKLVKAQKILAGC